MEYIGVISGKWKLLYARILWYITVYYNRVYFEFRVQGLGEQSRKRSPHMSALGRLDPLRVANNEWLLCLQCAPDKSRALIVVDR